MRASALWLKNAGVCASTAAVLPKDYSNLPYKKVNKPAPVRKDSPYHGLALLAPLPSPMRTNFIDRSPFQNYSNINNNNSIKSFRHAVCRSSDVSMRPQLFYFSSGEGEARQLVQTPNRPSSFGEKLKELTCRWAAKFYGNVTYGPRNYPYPSSRWLARRFRMKKHRIIKRFRFRRYKLAAIANLPFAKMIRVGMLPELKSSKTKKGDTVDSGLSQQLVNVAKSSKGGKTAGKRTRPKSKYQV